MVKTPPLAPPCGVHRRTFLEHGGLVNLCHGADVLVLLVHDCSVQAPAAGAPSNRRMYGVLLLLRPTWPLRKAGGAGAWVPVLAGGVGAASVGGTADGVRFADVKFELATLSSAVVVLCSAAQCRDARIVGGGPLDSRIAE